MGQASLENQKKLNKEQLEAVEAPLKPVIVIAPAGTGKTTVLTERVVYLIEKMGIPPNNILAITYTELAAGEMEKRIREKLKCKCPTDIGTIHSIFEKVLKSKKGIKEIDAGRDCNYVLLDDFEQESILKEAFENCEGNTLSDHKISEIKSFLSRWKKNKALNAKQCEIGNREIKIFEEYENLLKEANGLDFDDILIYSNQLLDKPEIQEHWRNRWQAILVDECQDLDELKWSLIKKLLPKGESFNFFAVGDPNQCIYLYDGAKENIFEEMRQHFGDAEETNLVVNYRSDKSIVDFSKELMKRKNDSLSYSPNKGIIKKFNDPSLALEEIFKDEKKESWVVLHRQHKDVNKIIEMFIQKNIPFKKSKVKRADPKEAIFFVIKILEIVFFDNSSPLRSLLWKGKLGLSEETKKQLTSLSSAPKGTTLVKYLLEEEEWKEKILFDIEGEKEKVFAILDQINQLRNGPKDNLSKLVQEIYSWLHSQKIFGKPSKKIKLFIKWLENIQKGEFNEDASRNILINMRSLAEFSTEEVNKGQNKWVTLSTIHKSKGLEWDNVIVLGYDKLLGEFNKDNSVDKHLAYVAATRAKNKLFLIEEPKVNLTDQI